MNCFQASVLFFFGCASLVLAQNDSPIQNYSLIQNCSVDAVAYTAEFLQNGAKYLRNLTCAYDFLICMPISFQTAWEICSRELDEPNIIYNWEIVLITDPSNIRTNYYRILQALCCVMTKTAESNDVTLAQIISDKQACFQKSCYSSNEC